VVTCLEVSALTGWADYRLPGGRGQGIDVDTAAALLERISRPCLVTTGSASDAVFRGTAKILASNIPSARLVELAGSGHLTYSEQPEEFADAVGAFAEVVATSA